MGDLNNVCLLIHPVVQLHYILKSHGAPVCLHSEPWDFHIFATVLDQGHNPSCLDNIDFLEKEFVDMIAKGQWTILMAAIA